ncbi:MAG TPA: glycosyltransferase family 2 protein, partial [Gemmataceae bacterium]|nr:glycosyltransferase family 2 protein [Gemmataceae bacterium]
RVCDPLPYRFEFLFVDDGSTDRSAETLAELRRQDSRVCYLVLSRNFGHQAALSAGLVHAAGEAVIMMDGDLQHPPGLIPHFLERFRDGYDVVNTIRRETVDIGRAKRWASRLFYRLFNWAASVHIEAGAADFRLMSRAAVDALNALPEQQRFLRGLVPWLGFRQTTIDFVAPSRWAGRPKYTFLRSLRFALDGITAFSFYPLRRAAVLGWTIMLASFLYGLYALGAHFLGHNTVPGWTSLMLCVVFLGGCQLLVAGVLGEYIGRILEQVKGRPMYIVQQAVGLPAALSKGRAVPLASLPVRWPAHEAVTEDPVQRAG